MSVDGSLIFCLAIIAVFFLMGIVHSLYSKNNPPELSPQSSPVPSPPVVPELADMSGKQTSLDLLIHDLLNLQSRFPNTEGGIRNYFAALREKQRMTNNIEYLELLEKQTAKIYLILSNAAGMQQKYNEIQQLLNPPPPPRTLREELSITERPELPKAFDILGDRVKKN